jgi:tRNA-dihydrouridine synthase
LGVHDELLTHLHAGEVCAGEGVAAIALHARTAQQHYAGDARWDAIAELKAHVSSIPVLGNGDIWDATDAIDMMRRTGCDGVVVGRGCLGRPWLFGDLLAVLGGDPAPRPRPLGFVLAVMADHADALIEHRRHHAGHNPDPESSAMHDFRKHTGWYLTGFPVGGDARRRFAGVSTRGELDDLIAALLDRTGPALDVVPGGDRIRRGHTNGPIRVALPDGYLDDPRALLDDATVPDDADVLAMSGG